MWSSVTNGAGPDWCTHSGSPPLPTLCIGPLGLCRRVLLRQQLLVACEQSVLGGRGGGKEEAVPPTPKAIFSVQKGLSSHCTPCPHLDTPVAGTPAPLHWTSAPGPALSRGVSAAPRARLHCCSQGVARTSLPGV